MAEVRSCQHIKSDGIQCGSLALRDRRYCYYHNKSREYEIARRRGRRSQLRHVNIPDLENPNAIQGALGEVIRLMLTDQIDVRKAGLVIYALQTAAKNLDQLFFDEVPPDELSPEEMSAMP